MDRLDAMKVFVAAVDAGSLAGAARTLKRSPASISRAIAYLETHLGAPLLHRTTRTMRLTDAGERYAPVCRHVLSELQDAEDLAGGVAPRGVLTLSAPPISGEEILRPIVDAFLRLQPAVSVRLLLLDRQVSLVDEGIDLALRVGELPASSLVAVRVGADVRRVVVAAPDYLGDRPPIARPGDLSDHDIVAMSHFGEDRWLFPPAAGGASPRTVIFAPRVLVTSVRAAAASAEAGLGVTRLYSYHVAEQVRRGALRIVLADDEPDPMPVHLVGRPGRAAAPKVRAFLDFAVPRLRAAFADLAAEARALPSVDAAS
ncbi:MAG: LysR family transcriptional regulator [Alphaproteobacteria bacterium]|nr:LysR family transcriptional regulator [Alphaproteobacteria bacterium]MBU1515163.1 LysR family transcriptional regulator [Alphaproteobacteria bacterium]MBU2092293.1 LysR family transcriptional regulator [Alphaproteobacteria bacterium]MBU2152887.1 LysR family transcriptional regulator [Alphaproteobacteria bacterium]MBU2305718.1 LysR family transcriptional regulator [Alphaproteobacteria bacterium]